MKVIIRSILNFISFFINEKNRPLSIEGKTLSQEMKMNLILASEINRMRFM